METKIIFRIDEDLKKEFERIAGEIDITSSQLLRHYIREFVTDYNKKNAQMSLLTTPKAEPKAKEAPKLSRAERRAQERRHK